MKMATATPMKKKKKPRLFSEAFQKSETISAIKPALNMKKGKDEYIVYVAVPGMERKDFSVSITNKLLTIKAHKCEALHCFTAKDEPVLAEWNETFALPDDADTVMTAAVYRNGELAIHIPRGNTGTTGKSVEVIVY
jgi:HSP20 family protein